MDPITGSITVASFFAAAGEAALSIAISYAVSMLTAPDIEGQRLSDMVAGGSSYGSRIPIAYGTVKLPGQVVWASDIIETKHEESTGFLGMGPEITTYTYSQHLAVMVCAGEVAGVRRIWANGRLIFDMSSSTTGATGNSGNIRIYPGSETQVADSLLETYLGTGNVPGHRGYCYVVFENLQLEDYGNRTPSMEFEVVSSGAQSYGAVTTITADANVGYQRMVVLPGNRLAYTYRDSVDYYTSLRIYDLNTDTLISSSSTGVNMGLNINALYAEHAREVRIFYGSSVYSFDADTGTYIGSWATGTTNIDSNDLYDPLTKRSICISGAYNNSIDIFDDQTHLTTLASAAAVSSMVAPRENGVVWMDGASDWGKSLQLIDLFGPNKLNEFSSPVQIRTELYGHQSSLLSDPTRNRVIWHVAAKVACFDIDSGDCTNFTISGFPPNVTQCERMIYNPVTDLLYAYADYSNDIYVLFIDPGTFEVVRYSIYSISDGKRIQGDSVIAEWAGDYMYSYGNDSLGDGGVFKIPISQRLSSSQVALSTIVSDLCERAGLIASDIDVTALTDIVDGYYTA